MIIRVSGSMVGLNGRQLDVGGNCLLHNFLVEWNALLHIVLGWLGLLGGSPRYISVKFVTGGSPQAMAALACTSMTRWARALQCANLFRAGGGGEWTLDAAGSRLLAREV